MKTTKCIHIARFLAAVLALGILIRPHTATPTPQNSPTPKQAWAKLKEHGYDVERLHNDYDSTIARFYMLMDYSESFAADQRRLEEFRNVIVDHYDTVYIVWQAEAGVIHTVLLQTRYDFESLDLMKDHFLQLATQMATKRDPQSEQQFRDYLKNFSNSLRKTDENYFDWMYKRFSKFAAECGQHGDTVKRFSDPTRKALQAYESRYRPTERGPYQQRFEQEVNEYKKQRADLINFLTAWDAKQGSVVAAADVIKNDWRRIHEDTKRLADFLDNPNFIKDLPDIDAKIVVDTFPRIRGYLDTYK